MLDIFDGLEERFNELADVVAGELRVAAVYSIGLHDLPPHLKAFRKKYPTVEVNVEYKRSAQVYTQVLSGEAAMGFVAYPIARKGIHVEPFMDDELVVICPPSHPFSECKKIAPPLLKKERFIAFDPDLPTRQVVDRHFRDVAASDRHPAQAQPPAHPGIKGISRAAPGQGAIVPLITAAPARGPRRRRPVRALVRLRAGTRQRRR